jgi:hypothetical protein
VAGILDNKTRIMDVVITEEGKRQITSGRMRIEFATFTDGHTFYQGDIASGSDDASNRLFFEATSLPTDQITFETDDSGNLISFNGGGFEIGEDGIVYQGSDNRRLDPIISGSVFSSLVDGVLSSSIDNFKNLQTIGSKTFLEDEEFETDIDFIDFNIANNSPFSDPDGAVISLDNIEPLFMDYRLGHVENFAFLPPVITADKSSTGESQVFGTYTDLNQSRVTTFDQILDKVWPGYPSEESIPQFSEVNFTKTSKLSNLMCQFFETGGVIDTRLKKLDIIDFGMFVLEEGSVKHVFFAGKIFIDSVGQPTFVNLFTLIFEDQE